MISQVPLGVRRKTMSGWPPLPAGAMLWGLVFVGVLPGCTPVQRDPGPTSGPPGPVVSPPPGTAPSPPSAVGPETPRAAPQEGGARPPDLPSATACPASTGQEIIDAVNVVRNAEGHPPLVPDLRLIAAARAHSRDMASRNELGHRGGDGSEVQDRAEARGYTWRMIAENVASGQPTVGTVMDSWLRSPGHRRNILDPGAVHLGVGLEHSSSGRTYWTQVFGAPDGESSLPAGGCHP